VPVLIFGVIPDWDDEVDATKAQQQKSMPSAKSSIFSTIKAKINGNAPKQSSPSNESSQWRRQARQDTLFAYKVLAGEVFSSTNTFGVEFS
jgi:hypothetical protein